MAAHNELGKEGEQIAVDALLNEGFHIIERNWRCGHKEIDIIAIKDNRMHIVEVKMRKDNDFGSPADAVDGRKIRYLVRAADKFVKITKWDGEVQFDIIAITGTASHFQLEHIQKAFYPPIG